MDYSRKVAGRQARITGVAERQAFEGYLRWGRTADPGTERKATGRELSVKALGDTRPTNYYTWRTAHDERVRPAHAANEGRVFAWSDPPPTGHPGHEPNCRCTAEPYYGTPFVSDASLPLKREARVDTTGQAVWRNIDTLTRPDGSLAQSTILMRDGTTIRSTFNGPLVVNNVTLPDGRAVRLERNDGVRSIYSGNSRAPLVQSIWTASGPAVVRPVTRMADLAVDAAIILPGRSRPISPVDAVMGLGDALFQAVTGIFDVLTAEPATLGAGTDDVPASAFRVWRDDRDDVQFAPLMAMAAAEVALSCKRLPEVQQWTTDAALASGPKPTGPAMAAWGTSVHLKVQRHIMMLRGAQPLLYGNLFTEYSVDLNAVPTAYATKGSVRLDVLEILPTAVCIYDIKTGDSGLSRTRAGQLAKIAAKYGKSIFFVIEIRPNEPVDANPPQ